MSAPGCGVVVAVGLAGGFVVLAAFLLRFDVLWVNLAMLAALTSGAWAVDLLLGAE